MNAQEIINEVTRVEEANELTSRGLNEFTRGNFEEVLSCANSALELNSENPLTLQLRALCKCAILVSRESINPADKAYLHEAILDLANATGLIHNVKSSARTFPVQGNRNLISFWI